MKIKYSISMMLACISLLSACGSLGFNYKPVIKEPYIGTSISIAIGTEDQGGLEVAKLMAASFEKKTTFKVKKVTDEVIAPPYKQSYTKVKVDFKYTDKAKIAEVAEKGDADYLFVFWPDPVVYTKKNVFSTVYYYQIFRGSVEVAQGDFPIRWVNRDRSVVVLGGKKQKETSLSITKRHEYYFDKLAAGIGKKMDRRKKEVK